MDNHGALAPGTLPTGADHPLGRAAAEARGRNGAAAAALGSVIAVAGWIGVLFTLEATYSSLLGVEAQLGLMFLLAVLAIVLGGVGVRQARSAGRSGRWPAVAALVLASVELAVLAMLAVLMLFIWSYAQQCAHQMC